MARRTEWQDYLALRSLIESAIGEALDNADADYFEVYTFAISPDLSEVVCYNDESEDETEMQFIERHKGWNIESAVSFEDALDIANLYFDIR